MMVFTTLFIAGLVLAILYFVVLRTIPWPWLGYVIVVGVGVACMVLGDVHFRYIGIEVVVIGVFVVWTHHHFKRRRTGTSET